MKGRKLPTNGHTTWRWTFLGMAVPLILYTATACRSNEPSVVGTTPSTTSTTEPTASPGPAPAPLDSIELDFVPVAEGFDQPLYVTGAGDDSKRLFVVEKTGRIWVLRDKRRLDTPFLDLSNAVSTQSEQGLLGLAFAPDFASSGIFYVDYTNLAGDTVISRLRASGDVAETASEQVLLTIDQPYANHNGGMLAFGPDGYLYIGTGDGGSGGDPHGNGQSLQTLLGKLLRIDVGGVSADRYGIPADNPFAEPLGERTPADTLDEIWAFGLRNPWRFSFDRETGDLWIADVGQNEWEEIDFQSTGSVGGGNYGWNVYEGTHPFPPGSAGQKDAGLFIMPVVEYDHSVGDSITGGYVYRGRDEPDLYGTYLYADFVTGRVWGLRRMTDGTIKNRLLSETDMAVSSFGEDDRGEVYVVDFNGSVYRIGAK